MSYRPQEPFTTVVELFNPTSTIVKGVPVKSWTKIANVFCSFKTYGGTESTTNDVLTVIDTANIETWYRPDITSSSQIRLGSKIYEVIGEPEDIEQRHQFIKFKVRGVNGGA